MPDSDWEECPECLGSGWVRKDRHAAPSPAPSAKLRVSKNDEGYWLYIDGRIKAAIHLDVKSPMALTALDEAARYCPAEAKPGEAPAKPGVAFGSDSEEIERANLDPSALINPRSEEFIEVSKLERLAKEIEEWDEGTSPHRCAEAIRDLIYDIQNEAQTLAKPRCAYCDQAVREGMLTCIDHASKEQDVYDYLRMQAKPGETPKEYVCRGCGKPVSFTDLKMHGGVYEHSGHQRAEGEPWKLWCGPVEPVEPVKGESDA